VATSGTGNVVVLCGINPEDETGRVAISDDSGITWKYPHDIYTNKIFTSVTISSTGNSIALSGPSVLFMGEFDENSNFYNFIPVSGPEADMVIGLEESVITNVPTIMPSPGRPTKAPTQSPTYNPTISPTFKPTKLPSVRPSRKPTMQPTYKPTITSEPTYEPTGEPTEVPTLPVDMQTDCTYFNCILRIENSNGLSLAEIEIYLSGNKITYPGWISSISEPIENCMDNDYNTKCSTESFDTEPRIEITLTGLKFDTIEIWNRADCCFDSISGTTLTLLTDDGGMLWLNSITTDISTPPLPTYSFIPALGFVGSPLPTQKPTTYKPSVLPTKSPTPVPSRKPTQISNSPTVRPTMRPTKDPTVEPTFKPTIKPTFAPTRKPTRSPTSRERYQCTPDLFDNCCNGWAYILFTNVFEIPDGTFMNCNNFVWVTIPSTVTTIGKNAFKGCSNLNTLFLNEGVTSIGMSAFEGTAIKSLILPLSLQSLGAAAFKDNIKMSSLQIQPQFLSVIANNTFNGCASLTNVVVPLGIVSIGSSAFKDCLHMTSISIADTVTQIGSEAFTGVPIHCIFWDETIERTVEDVLLQSLPSCANYVDPRSPTPPPVATRQPTVVGAVLCSTFTGCCGNAANVVIPDTVTAIPNFAFISCSSLKTVVIPSTVTSIGRYAFHQTGLTSIVIPEGVTSVGWWSFAQSYSLTSITLPDSLVTLSNGVFNGCPFTCINWNPSITRANVVGDTFGFGYDTALKAEDKAAITCGNRRLQLTSDDNNIDQYTETIAFDNFVFPYGLAVSPIDDSIYVTDPVANTISKINVRTSRSTILPITSTRNNNQYNPLITPPNDNIIDAPTQIAIHTNGLIFVLDRRFSYPTSTSGVLLVINPHTYVVNRFTSIDIDDLDSFLVSPDGYIYVTKPSAGSLYKLSTDTQGTATLVWSVDNVSLQKLVFIGNELFSFSTDCSISKIDPVSGDIDVIDDNFCSWGVFPTTLGTIHDILVAGTFNHLVEMSIDQQHIESIIQWNKLINGLSERVIPISIAVTRSTNSIFAILISEESFVSQVVKLSPPRSLQANYWNGFNNNNQRTAIASNNGPINVVQPLWIYNSISTSSISSLVVDNHGVIYCIQNDRILKIDADGNLLDNLPGTLPVSLTLGTTDILYINDVTELRAIDVSNGMTTVWLLRDPNVNSNDAKLLGFSGGVLYTNNIIYATAFSGFILS